MIVDGIEGPGHYVGTYIALTSLQRYWWGEGELKFFIDDDGDFATQSSTGLEDYAGGAWAFQDALRRDPAPKPITFSAPYFGYPYYSSTDSTKASPFATPTLPSHGMYRWHLLDPIVFTERLRSPCSRSVRGTTAVRAPGRHRHHRRRRRTRPARSVPTAPVSAPQAPALDRVDPGGPRWRCGGAAGCVGERAFGEPDDEGGARAEIQAEGYAVRR